MADIPKPLPIPDADSLPFWQATKRHELVAQQCTDCAQWRWPPQGFCPDCYSWNFAWRELEGRGTVLSFVVVQEGVGSQGFAGDVPYVVGKIELDGMQGRVVMTSNVIGCDWQKVRVGMRVVVSFEDVNSTIALPKFTPST